VCRPRRRSLDVVGEVCKLLSITLQKADQLARNRVLWSCYVYQLLERADSLASSKHLSKSALECALYHRIKLLDHSMRVWSK